MKEQKFVVFWQGQNQKEGDKINSFEQNETDETKLSFDDLFEKVETKKNELQKSEQTKRPRGRPRKILQGNSNYLENHIGATKTKPEPKTALGADEIKEIAEVLKAQVFSSTPANTTPATPDNPANPATPDSIANLASIATQANPANPASPANPDSPANLASPASSISPARPITASHESLFGGMGKNTFIEPVEDGLFEKNKDVFAQNLSTYQQNKPEKSEEKKVITSFAGQFENATKKQGFQGFEIEEKWVFGSAKNTENQPQNTEKSVDFFQKTTRFFDSKNNDFALKNTQILPENELNLTKEKMMNLFDGFDDFEGLDLQKKSSFVDKNIKQQTLKNTDFLANDNVENSNKKTPVLDFENGADLTDKNHDFNSGFATETTQNFGNDFGDNEIENDEEDVDFEQAEKFDKSSFFGGNEYENNTMQNGEVNFDQFVNQNFEEIMPQPLPKRRGRRPGSKNKSTLLKERLAQNQNSFDIAGKLNRLNTQDKVGSFVQMCSTVPCGFLWYAIFPSKEERKNFALEKRVSFAKMIVWDGHSKFAFSVGDNQLFDVARGRKIVKITKNGWAWTLHRYFGFATSLFQKIKHLSKRLEGFGSNFASIAKIREIHNLIKFNQIVDYEELKLYQTLMNQICSENITEYLSKKIEFDNCQLAQSAIKNFLNGSTPFSDKRFL